MAVGRQIYELHQLDASIIDTDTALALVERKLTDDSELRKAEAVLRRAQEKLADVERRQREAEAHMSDIQARLGPLETKTYDGSVGNPRELQSMEREVENLKKRLSEAEDSFLNILDEQEAAAKVVAEKEAQCSAAKKKRKTELKDLANEKDKLEFDLLELWEKRDGRASALDTDPKNLYETLRQSLGGLALATIGRGMCNICRISLPMNVVQKAKAGRELSQCPTCSRNPMGRVVHVPSPPQPHVERGFGVISGAIIQTDGASRGNPGPASIGSVIWDYEGQVIAEVSKAIGIATSNVAEYRALVETLAKALELGVEFVDIRLDSELIVRQVNGSYRTRKPKLKKLLSQVQGLLRSFDGYVIQHVPRWDNRHADALANRALNAR